MKFARVNMTSREINVEDVPATYTGLGGRGLTSILINTEVPPDCDALGPDNKLIFAPGTLSGTSLVNTSRLSIGAKSPLTGGIKESNVGGTVAAALGRMGLAAIIVEGQAPQGELYILKINGAGEADLLAANDYEKMRTYTLVEKLFETEGDDNAILCIGPAGELQLSSASIQSSDADGRPCRAAGRGGLGAVMGAKGLKALLVDRSGKNRVVMTDQAAFKKEAKIFAKAVKEDMFSGYILPPLGTAVLVAPLNAAGAFPSYNATKGIFEGWESISGETLAETMKDRGGKTTHMGCAQCIIHCSNEYVDGKGNYVTSSLEYETIWSMGGMCGIDDLDIIARLDFLCDDIGVDTMNTGVAVAVAMDAGYKKFGDGQAAIEMVEQIGNGTEFGKTLGNGPAAVGRHFNHQRVPVVKNQSIAAYDPRAAQGMGVTYGTSPMGADHTAGNVIDKNLDSLGGNLDPLKADGQIEVSRDYQIETAAFDCTGLCLFALSAAKNNAKAAEALLKMINSRLGSQLSFEDLIGLGVRVLKAERDFNRKAGFTAKDDRLPQFFYEEPLPPHNTVFVVSDESMDKVFDF